MRMGDFGFCADSGSARENGKIEWKKRLFFAGIFVLLFAVECLIALYVRDRFIRPYVGDMLVVVLLYFFIRVLFPGGIRRLPLWVFLFAAAVEVSQYFHLAALLRVEHIRAARLILGSTFDIKDLACYGAGCLALVFLERKCGMGKHCAVPESRSRENGKERRK